VEFNWIAIYFGIGKAKVFSSVRGKTIGRKNMLSPLSWLDISQEAREEINLRRS
jgi:hypothetical protein